MSADPLGEPHSAVHFDEQRDFWWNLDFLRLVAARLDLARARSVLDVGSGLGHWGRALLAVLSPQVTVVAAGRRAGAVCTLADSTRHHNPGAPGPLRQRPRRRARPPPRDPHPRARLVPHRMALLARPHPV
ncbi:MAG: hypothetical protein ACLP22_06025 [Solirubrobacteraceae bacterium]